MARSKLTGILAFTGALASVLAVAGPAAAGLRADCDFNADGRSDMVIASVNEAKRPAEQAGMVAVIPGASRVDPARATLWTQDSPGVPDSVESYELFGLGLACGDFNGDGKDDLAIGSPNETVGDAPGTGLVTVLYGSGGGLRSEGAQTFDEDSPGLGDETEVDDRFGYTLASGDFNGDGKDDLVIGTRESYGGADRAGAVHVLYGSDGGVRSRGASYFRKDTFGETPSTNDHFGYAIAAGDLDADGMDDLVIGTPEDDVEFDVDDAGSIRVLRGSPAGVTTEGSQLWWSGSSGLVGPTVYGGLFGQALAIGDFNRDGRDDVAVGVPQADAGRKVDAGYVHVIYGGTGGLTTTRNTIINQNTRGVPDRREERDFFGRSLASGDFDSDGFDDLAIGAPLEKVKRKIDAGTVTVLYGAEGGMNGSGAQLWTQSKTRAGERSEKSDLFGLTMAAGDFDGDGDTDLVIGAPYDDLGRTLDAGNVVLLLGARSTGLGRLGAQVFDGSSVGGSPGKSEYFGSFDIGVAIYGF